MASKVRNLGEAVRKVPSSMAMESSSYVALRSAHVRAIEACAPATCQLSLCEVVRTSGCSAVFTP